MLGNKLKFSFINPRPGCSCSVLIPLPAPHLACNVAHNKGFASVQARLEHPALHVGNDLAPGGCELGWVALIGEHEVLVVPGVRNQDGNLPIMK